jgi:hypothetical protein
MAHRHSSSQPRERVLVGGGTLWPSEPLGVGYTFFVGKNGYQRRYVPLFLSHNSNGFYRLLPIVGKGSAALQVWSTYMMKSTDG